jgi:acetolactate synthase regulatory subunit
MAGLTGELQPRTPRGFGLCQFALSLPRTTIMSHVAAPVSDDHLPATACFSVHARSEPGVMPRVLELFAKRGLVPSFWQSSTSGSDGTRLKIEIQMRGLLGETIDYMAACLRQITFVEVVVASQKHAPVDRSMIADVVQRSHPLVQQLRSGAGRAVDRRERAGRAAAS